MKELRERGELQIGNIELRKMVEELEESKRKIEEKIKKDDDTDSGVETENDTETDSDESRKTIICRK